MQRIATRQLIGRNHPGTEGAGALEILSLSHVEFRVAQPVPDGSFIHQGHPGDVIPCPRFRYPSPLLADDQHNLTLVVELF